MPKTEQRRQHMRLTTELLELIGKSELTDRKVSMLATSTPDTVRNMRRGSNPRCGTMEALCDILGVELRLTPRTEPTLNGTTEATPETSFDDATRLPVRRWAGGTVDGMLERSPVKTAPAPQGWRDMHACYRVARGSELEAAGIRDGDVCLISATGELRRDTIGWFRNRDGSETMGWTAGMTPDGFQVVRWTREGKGRRPSPEVRLVRRDEIDDRGIVARVYERTPDASGPLRPRPAWTPAAADALWQNAVIDGDSNVRQALDAIGECAEEVERAGRRIGQLRTDGKISKTQAEHCVNAMESVIRRRVATLHASVGGAALPDEPRLVAPHARG